MNYMQGVNDGLMMANRRLREDLQDVNDLFQELTAVAKEVVSSYLLIEDAEIFKKT